MISGDIKINVNDEGFTSSNLFRIMFNTAFIKNNIITAGKLQLSPEDIRKQKILPDDLKVHFVFENFCEKCDSFRTQIDDLCKRCVS